MRVLWDLRLVWSDSYMAREDKLRLYKAAVVSSCVYGCGSWMITPEVVAHLCYMNGRCLAQVYGMTVEDFTRKPPWCLVGSIRLRRNDSVAETTGRGKH